MPSRISAEIAQLARLARDGGLDLSQVSLRVKADLLMSTPSPAPDDLAAFGREDQVMLAGPHIEIVRKPLKGSIEVSGHVKIDVNGINRRAIVKNHILPVRSPMQVHHMHMREKQAFEFEIACFGMGPRHELTRIVHTHTRTDGLRIRYRVEIEDVG